MFQRPKLSPVFETGGHNDRERFEDSMPITILDTEHDMPKILRRLDRGSEPGDRQDAANALSRLRITSKEVFSALIRSLKYDEEPCVRGSAMNAVAIFGAEAIPHLIEALEDPDRDVRDSASLSLIMNIKHDALPALKEALRRPNIRDIATRTIQLIEMDTPRNNRP